MDEPTSPTSLTYRQAGVDIEAGEETVRRIRPMVRSTFTPRVLADIGSFGGLFRADFGDVEEPVLVSSVDGVGTKLKVAFLTGRHDTVGQDLVNHCVNDIGVCGAEPLFFLDYFATGHLAPDIAEQVVSGFVKACRENGCALIGGETAEMPDMYADGEYDLAGTVVGVVDRPRLVDGKAIRPGDVLVGLSSTGLHTNGYTLARKALLQRYTVTDRPDALGGPTIGEALLAIHRSYLPAIRAMRAAGDVRGLVHITGGGLPGNTRRIVPDGLLAQYDYSSWERPALFRLIAEAGSVPEDDQRSAFNLGIGLVAICSPDDVPAVVRAAESCGDTARVVGRIVS